MLERMERDMYTFESANTRIHYNSDLSGYITIINKADDSEVVVYGKDIIRFVANYVRDEKISKLEQTSDEEILGLK